MWTFDRFPAARMQSELGWAPDRAWLDSVAAGTARLPQCSGANVSAAGLVLTNQHCLISCLRDLSTPAANILADGMMARTRAEERRCPGLAIMVLDRITDVTARIDAAAARAGPAAFAPTRDAEIARLEHACSARAHRCEVVTLYQGGRYGLYEYQSYDDVRLVFAPEQQMAAFGGDADNFSFPRYCIDFAFLRLYTDGAPAATPAHLSMRFTPLNENEIVLVAGNPGATSRQRTTAQIMFERDVVLAWRLDVLGDARARVAAFAARGPAQALIAADTQQSVDNAFKEYQLRARALADPAGFAHVSAAEADLQARVGRNRAAAREAGDAWGEIARAQEAYRRFFYQHQYLEFRAGERSELFALARDIVRAAAERAKPSAERLPRYADERLAGVGRYVLLDRRIDSAFEQINLQAWLTGLARRLPAGLARRVLGAQTPEALAARLAQSQLADTVYREQLWDAPAAVATSPDPMIAFVRAWDGDARAVRARYVAQVEAPVAGARERIARARFRAFGEAAYPNATFSPRLSYGRVEGWSEPGGQVVGAFTRMSGLYERAAGGAPLTAPWVAAQGRLDASLIFNLSSSTDVIGGNSGSALLDRDGRVVGAAFDGNAYSLGGEYFYDRALNRTVSVASTVIEAALRDVYAMDALMAELRE